jgi:CheY-like chemotaxis protein
MTSYGDSGRRIVKVVKFLSFYYETTCIAWWGVFFAWARTLLRVFRFSDFFLLLDSSDLLNNFSLLVADQDRDYRTRYQDLARTGRYQVHMVGSGHEAFEIAGDQSFHLTIVDDRVPEMGGIETIRLLMGRTPILPCVLVVQNPTKERRMEALGAGAVTMITKPFDLEMLHVTVDRIIEKCYPSVKSFGSS